MAITSHRIYESLLSEHVFRDEEAVGRVLANYANSLKLPLTEENVDKALRCYADAVKLVGMNPSIQQGLTFYLERKQGTL